MTTTTDTHPLTLTADPDRRKTIARIMVEAMRIETSSRERNAETVALFRFNDAEIARYRDGFGLAQMGVAGFRKFIAETFFLSRDTALTEHSSFATSAIEFTEQQANSAPAFGWIISPTNTRLDQIKVGRLYARIHLTVTALGLVQHPLSQVLQEYPAMVSLQQELSTYLGVPSGQTIQMLFRLGQARLVTPAPRRHLADLIRV